MLSLTAFFGYYYIFTGLPINLGMYFADYPHNSTGYSDYSFYDQDSSELVDRYKSSNPYRDIFGSEYALLTEYREPSGEVKSTDIRYINHESNTTISSRHGSSVETNNYTLSQSSINNHGFADEFASKYNSTEQVETKVSPVDSNSIYPSLVNRVYDQSMNIYKPDNISDSWDKDTIERPMKETEYLGRETIVYKIKYKPTLGRPLLGNDIYSILYVDKETGLILKLKAVSPSEVTEYEVRTVNINLSESNRLADEVLSSDQKYVNLELNYNTRTSGILLYSYPSYPDLSREKTIRVSKNNQTYETKVPYGILEDTTHLYVDDGELEYEFNASNQSDISLKDSNVSVLKSGHLVTSLDLSENTVVKQGYPLNIDVGSTEDYIYVYYDKPVDYGQVSVEFSNHSVDSSYPYVELYLLNKSEVEYPIEFKVQVRESQDDTFFRQFLEFSSNTTSKSTVNQTIAEYSLDSQEIQMLDEHTNAHVVEDEYDYICSVVYDYNFSDTGCSISEEVDPPFELEVENTDLQSFS